MKLIKTIYSKKIEITKKLIKTKYAKKIENTEKLIKTKYANMYENMQKLTKTKFAKCGENTKNKGGRPIHYLPSHKVYAHGFDTLCVVRTRQQVR